MPHHVDNCAMHNSGETNFTQGRHRRRLLTHNIVLSLAFLCAFADETSAFQARLQPPWVLGRYVPPVKLLLVDEKVRENRQASSAYEGDEMEVEADDDSDGVGTARREEWPNGESTFEAAQAYHAVAASHSADAELHRSHAAATLSRGKINVDRPRTQRSMATAGGDTNEPTIRSCLGQLLSMCRPSNFPGVVLFHILGVHRALSSPAIAASTAAAAALTGKELLIQTLLRPSMLVVLVTLLLVTSTSMLVNDYYDAKNGVDAINAAGRPRLSDPTIYSYTSTKPLVSGEVPMSVAKDFLNFCLYPALLLGLVFVPGAPARLSVVLGAMITFWYTNHLKPKTWTKNASVASLVALSPLASGSAALHLLSESGRSAFGGMGGIVASLGRLVLTLFSGIMSREVLMDIKDYHGDRAAGVVTVPVKHGRRYASRVALGFTCLMSALAVSGPAVQLVRVIAGMDPPALRAIMVTPAAKKLMLALLGSAMQLQRALRVSKTEGNESGATDRAIEEGKLSVLFILASFV